MKRMCPQIKQSGAMRRMLCFPALLYNMHSSWWLNRLGTILQRQAPFHFRALPRPAISSPKSTCWKHLYSSFAQLHLMSSAPESVECCFQFSTCSPSYFHTSLTSLKRLHVETLKRVCTVSPKPIMLGSGPSSGTVATSWIVSFPKVYMLKP